ncbi:zinc finger protein 34-like isoform X3 [Pleurodeles waltl]|uniref:zinc finger protein 34-like isoform X3 n=1 Tax=Pleurodeles waltl TaxID=8319 RepID=UPI0037095A8A
MSQPGPEKAEFTFYDVAARFSDDEWKLLHEWQKELYNNVMKEIQEALYSLGPLIAISVFSLRAKGKEELYSTNKQDSEGSHSTNPSPSPVVNAEFSSIDNNTDETHFKDEPEAEGNSPEPIVISPHDTLSSEEDADLDSTDYHGSETSERTSRTTAGVGIMNRQRKVRASIPFTKQKTPCKSLPRESKIQMSHSSHKGITLRRQVWGEGYQSKRGKKPTQFGNRLHQGMTKGRILQKYNEYEHNPKHSQFPNDLENTEEQNQPTYTCNMCGKICRLKEEFMRHMADHRRVGPYACTDCDKSFLQKGNLVKHYRTHTGEKPFPCEFCQKRFGRKDYLHVHMRLHTGERPYKCNDCGKSFTWKGDYNQHRRKHTCEDLRSRKKIIKTPK